MINVPKTCDQTKNRGDTACVVCARVWCVYLCECVLCVYVHCRCVHVVAYV